MSNIFEFNNVQFNSNVMAEAPDPSVEVFLASTINTLSIFLPELSLNQRITTSIDATSVFGPRAKVTKEFEAGIFGGSTVISETNRTKILEVSLSGSTLVNPRIRHINSIEGIINTTSSVNPSLATTWSLTSIISGNSIVSSDLLDIVANSVPISGASIFNASLKKTSKLIVSGISSTSSTVPDLSFSSIKRIITRFTGKTVVNPTVKVSHKVRALNINGVSIVDSTSDVGHIFELTTTINTASNVSPDLLVGNTKTFEAIISGGSSLGTSVYNIECISEGNDNLKLWGDEVTAYTYGSLDYTSHLRGNFCFKGTPDSLHSPTLSLGLKNRVTLADYDAIWFFVKASSANRNIRLSLYRWPYTITPFNLDPYIQGGDLTTSWRLVKLPLSVIEANGNGWTRDQGIEHFKFGAADTTGAYSIYVDEIWAVDSEAVDASTAPYVGEFKAYQFSNTRIGGSNEQVIRLYNAGFSTLDICDIDITGADAEHFATFIPTISSAIPGAYIEIPVEFIPQTSGTKSASLVVRHSDTMFSDTSVISITGLSLGATVYTDTTSLNFGSISDDKTMDWVLPVSNIGNENLIITGISSSDPSFSIVSYDALLEPSATSDMIIRFSNDSTLINFDGKSTVRSELAVIRGLNLDIFSAKTVFNPSDMYIEVNPFGSSIISGTSTASFGLGLTYRLSLEITNEILGFTHVYFNLGTANGFTPARSFGRTTLDVSLSVTKTYDTIFNGNSVVNPEISPVNTSDTIFVGRSIVTSRMKVEKLFSINLDTSSEVDTTLSVTDWSVPILGGKSVVTARLTDISAYLSRGSHYPTPVITFIRSHYPWLHNDVYSRDIGEIRRPEKTVYTDDEVDNLVIDKATKTGETQHGNIALLRGSDGDLLDSGVHPNDLITRILDYGTF